MTTGLTTDRQHALAEAMLDAIGKVVEGYDDNEIFTALIILLCSRIAKEPDPAVPARRVIDMIAANFLPPAVH